MKVSVITAVFSNQAFIQDAIQSVLSQQNVEIEYIIVDGGSKDGTVDVVKSFGNQISKFISEPDEGVYFALNKGIALATGDIIALLHSDDYYAHPFVLSQVVEAFEKTKCDAVYSNLYYVKSSNTNKIVRLWDSGVYKPNDFFYGWMPPHPAFFAKREVYQKYGSFNTLLKSAADYELMLRFILNHQIQLQYIPKFFVKMRTGGASNRSFLNRLKANIEDRRAWQINSLNPKWYTLLLKPFVKLFQYRFFSYFRPDKS
ncbi:MAG: glycosyltransferase [Bacteroidia bacterium]|nr:glycosyltransferase [Bacteroidia bacterium]MCF8426176.1 glycosyltransferase [Bacteroidia bacterium]MCF8445524.1 glycosyltransferase [Bacteroidia bacterium]